jgi:hypothetical protein
VTDRSSRPVRARFAIAALALSLLLGACAAFDPQPVDVQAGPNEIQEKTEQAVTVSTTILSDEQALRLYGVDLADVGLQAVWLRIENDSEHAQWLLVSALDPNYFPPDEAAVLFHPSLSDEDEAAVTRHFRELAIPLKTPAGGTSEGYVLAPRHEGGRYVMVKLVNNDGILNFGFAVTLPDGDFDFERLDPDKIYGERELPDLDLEQLRAELRALPCCVTDQSGEREGDPLNLVLVGNVGDLLSAMSRAGWSFTHRIDANTVGRMLGAAISGASYPVAPVSPLYFAGRPQDMALQRARNTIVQRNHLRLWLAPFRFEGRSIWIGQISRDIAVKATTLSPTLTTHVIDPNVDEAREHLLQSLLVAGAIERFAFVTGMAPVPPAEPRRNLTDDPYFTDGLRFVALLSSDGMTPPEEAIYLEWRKSADPIQDAKQESLTGEQESP